MKSTRNSLLTSVITMLLCCVLFVGTTFAYFADNENVSTQSITFGKMEVQVVNAQGTQITATETLKFQTTSGDTTTDMADTYKWLPGDAYSLGTFKIKNNGDVDMKYKIEIAVPSITIGEESNVALPGTWTIKIGNTEYTQGSDIELTAGQTSENITITYTVPADLDAKFMSAKFENIQVKVSAKQTNSNATYATTDSE